MKREGTTLPLGDASAVHPLEHAGGMANLVELAPDHPGFTDAAYRARRDDIARLALAYREGDAVPHVVYTEEEHAVWREVWRHLDPLHDRFACHAYRTCAAHVALPRARIPQLADVNATLARSTGFRMLPVAGLVASRTFLAYLGRGIFLSTQYMRHASRPLYTPEPDVIHELVGHAASFDDPALAALNRAFGAAVLHADDHVMERIARVYWFTLEFGVVRERGRPTVYGAGLLSSAGELERFAREAELRPFVIDDVASTEYDPTEYQRTLFVADGLDDVVREVGAWLRSLAPASG